MPNFDHALRTAKAHFLSIPLFTRVVLVVTFGLFIFGRVTGQALEATLSLDPQKIDLKELHRLNTYPLVHIDVFHLLFNLIALVPTLGAYEKEKGTLTTILMILGPFSTFPAALYLFFEIYIIHGTASVVGSSVWVFLFAAVEATKAYRINPFYSIAGFRIPTWSSPLIFTLVAALLFPSSSFLGHLCAIAVGYAYALNYLKFFEPPEKILAFVEGKLRFVLDKIKPHYIGLEMREPWGGASASGMINAGGSYLPVANPTSVELVGTGPGGRTLAT